MTVRRTADHSPRPITTPKAAAPVPAARAETVPAAARAPDSFLSQAAEAVKGAAKRFERLIIDGHDGFVAIDPATGKIASGDPGGAVVRHEWLKGLLPEGLAKLLADAEDGEPVKIRVRPNEWQGSGRTDGHGVDATSLDQLQSALGSLQLNEKRGNLITVDIEAGGTTAQQRVLALPKDYDGPLFVSDIDDTLRQTHLTDVVHANRAPPIGGAKELLEAVAARGIPIVFLSAGTERIGPLNDDFLSQLPPGVLLSRDHLGLSGLDPRNHVQATAQGNYKAQRLEELKAAYPHAKLFGLGDDKYGDALAYTAAGARAFIHDVRPGDDNLPATFSGVTTRQYDGAFRARVLGELDQAISASKSFH